MDNLIIQIVIAVCTALLAAFLTNIRFKNEKWWERKADAYVDLIEALHDMKWFIKEHWGAEFEGKSLPEEYKEEIWSKYKLGKEKIWRVAETSSFIVSPEVSIVIHSLVKALSKNNAESYFEDLDEQLGAIDICIDKVKNIAKKELSIKKNF